VVGFLFAALGAVLAGALGASTLRLRSLAVFVVGSWVLVCAELVAAGEVLSLFHAIRPLGYAMFEAIVLIAVLVVWHRAGRPRPPRLPRLPRRPPPVALLALAVAVALGVGYELFLVVATPPNNWDSMHYHLARVAAWHAQHDLGWFPTHNAIENVYPPNAELLVLWTVTFLGRDLLAALPQLLASLATAVSVFAIARRLGYERRASAFSAFLFPTLTIVALESVTTQNDLLEASFVAAAVALALGRTRAETALAGIALGLAAGTKFTFLYAVPVLLVVALVAVPRRRLLELCAAAAAGFVLVGMYGYVQNLAETGRPQGKAHEVSSLPPHVTARGTVSSVARTTYRLVDLSGLHPPAAVTSHVAGAAKRLFDGLHIPPNPPESTTKGTFEFAYEPSTVASEDSSALGPLGFLLLVPLALGFLVAWVRRKADRRHAAFALALPLYVVALALGTRWNLYVDRFLVTPAALTLPLAPAVLRRMPVQAVVAVIAAATLAVALAYDLSKPRGVWNRSRAEAQAIRWPELQPVLEAVQSRVPARARLGIDLAPLDWEYPWWGPHLQRRLVWLPAQSADGVDWVLLGSGITARPAGAWCAQRFPTVGWTLLHRC
jgi:hypothetical protein